MNQPTLRYSRALGKSQSYKGSCCSLLLLLLFILCSSSKQQAAKGELYEIMLTLCVDRIGITVLGNLELTHDQIAAKSLEPCLPSIVWKHNYVARIITLGMVKMTVDWANSTVVLSVTCPLLHTLNYGDICSC
jgi:hypothetical protein